MSKSLPNERDNFGHIIHFLWSYGIFEYFINTVIWQYIIRLFSKYALYQYLIHLLLCVIVLILYVIVAKWHKFKKGNDVIPFRMFVEECFEKNYEQEKVY